MNENDNQIDEVEIASLGIRRVERNLFWGGEYTHCCLGDAITAARRRAKR